MKKRERDFKEQRVKDNNGLLFFFILYDDVLIHLF